jgi:hypothetical protein
MGARAGGVKACHASGNNVLTIQRLDTTQLPALTFTLFQNFQLRLPFPSHYILFSSPFLFSPLVFYIFFSHYLIFPSTDFDQVIVDPPTSTLCTHTQRSLHTFRESNPRKFWLGYCKPRNCEQLLLVVGNINIYILKDTTTKQQYVFSKNNYGSEINTTLFDCLCVPLSSNSGILWLLSGTAKMRLHVLL